MTSDELLFRAWAQALGRPWSADAHLRARERAAFSVAMAERKISECFARVAVIAVYQEELRELAAEVDAWTARAERQAIEADRTRQACEWVGSRPVAEDEEPPRWVLDGLGRWRDTWRESDWDGEEYERGPST